MSSLKYIERLRRMDRLIFTKSTGNAKEFSEKLDISISQLKEEIRHMRELGAKIEFNRLRNTYMYQGDYRLYINFVPSSKIQHRPVLLDDE